MKGGFALAALCSLLGSGCTRVVGPNAGHNPWTQAGVLRIAEHETPDNLNVALGTELIDFDLAAFWAATLFRWSDRGELVPELATAEPTQHNGGISRDGLTITYHLRRGVTWQDGAPFTVRDVVFTWHAMLNPRNLVVSRQGYDDVERVETPDDYTAVVHLKTRYAPFVNTFFGPSNPMAEIMPEHLLARYSDINRIAYNSSPIGTGPFKVLKYDPGQGIVLVANDAYWRGTPKLRRVEIKFVGSDQTILTMLQTHEIDFYYRASEALAAVLRDVPGTRVILTPYDRFIDVGLNASTPGLNDVRVRRALAYATDRDALIDKVMHGVALRGETNHASFTWSYNGAVPKYPYDPSKAASLLAQAGWRRGTLHLTLVGPTGSTTGTATEALLQSMWGKVGVDVTIKNFPTNQLFATLGAGGIEQRGKFDAVLEDWSNGTDPNDAVLVMCSMTPPAGWNIYHFCDPQLDAAEHTALTSYDRAIRANAYGHIARIIAGKLPFVVLWYVRLQDVVNTDFHGYKPARAITPFWNPWEWSI